MSYKCDKCGKDGFDSLKSVRSHQIGANHYDKDSFRESITELPQGQEGEDAEEQEEIQEDSDNEDLNSLDDLEDEKDAKNEEDEDLETVDEDGMESTDLDSLLEEDSEEEQTEEEEEEDESKPAQGLAKQVNQGIGSLGVIGLEENDKKERMRKDIQRTAEDFGLGQNAKWYYEEELQGETDDPKKALMGSSIAVAIVIIAQRPDLQEKIKNGVQNAKDNAQTSTEEVE